VQSGFQFPWTDDLLVQASPAIASREFLREGPVAVGRTEPSRRRSYAAARP
jgi:hypothetical protein